MPRVSSVKKRNEQRERYYKKYSAAAKRGKRWSGEDEKKVSDKILCDVELHKILGRSIEAIQVKRCNLKKET